jgi:16S rRNA (cytidine1402-2'-O)-methyltransferase
VVETVRNGGTVLVVTDAGMPGVSDPGLRAVRAVLEAGLKVSALPGPSAALTALALSGLPSDRFCFEGFLPRTGSGRRSRLRGLAAEPRTLVFFEAPHRITAALQDLAAAFGADRAAAVCRELTKTYEEIRRGPLGELAQWAAAAQPRGEITVVVAGAPAGPPPRPSDAELRTEVAEHEAGGASRRDAIQAVADAYGLRKREVYALVHTAT